MSSVETRNQKEKRRGRGFARPAVKCAHKSLVPPDLELNADVWMMTLPVTPSACGNYASVEYNKLHV